MSEKLKYDFYIIRGDQFANNVVHMDNLDEMPKHTAPVLVDMHEKLWKFEKDFYGDFMPPPRYTMIRELVCEVHDPSLFFMFIYRYNDEGMKELIGYMMVQWWLDREIHHYNIKELFIEEEYRRQGLATTAVQKFMENVKRWVHKCNILFSIDVHKKNQIAMSFYRKIGFVDYHETLVQKVQPEE